MAQEPAPVRLEGVEITATRLDHTSTGKHTEHIDSTAWKHALAPNLAVLLAQQTPLFVRSYGNGSLATLGIRGGSSSQTQLLWNGVPLRNPMIGLTDLALIPTGLLDNASIHYGGHGAAFGSGAMGGLIRLGSSVRQRADGIEVQGNTGSWGQRMGVVRADYGTDRLRLTTRFVTQQADNDFQYRLNRTAEPRTQVHHALRHRSLVQEVRWDARHLGALTARLWYQHADRQIPPTSVQNTSRAAQQDENIRAMLHWESAGASWSWEVRTAWLDETIDYQDSLIALYTTNRFRTWLGEGAFTHRISERFRLAGGVYLEQAWAASGGYADDLTRGQQAAYASARLRTGDFVWRLQAREERTDGGWSPLLWDVAFEWEAGHGWVFKGSSSRNYRVPTLNDLHWRPGGNASLQPEEGVTTEAGIRYRDGEGRWSWEASLTGYTRQVNQWIMWLPPVDKDRPYWAPVNVARVTSRGLEWRTRGVWTSGRWKLQGDLGLDLTWSVFDEPVPDLKIERGDQMLYVPVDNLVVGARATFDRWSLFYRHYGFGTSPGINEPVAAARVATAGGGVHFSGEEVGLHFFVQVDNLWNSPYRIVERRPMPGRGFQLGVRLAWEGKRRNVHLD